MSFFRACITTFIMSFGLITPAGAEMLWPDSMNYDSLNGRGTYNSGDYTILRDNNINHSPLYQETIRDNRTGNYLDCDFIGTCRSR